MQTTKDIFKKHTCCVIIPVYNNERTIAQVIEGCLQFCDDVFVVNDGSTDGTAGEIARFNHRITLIQQDKNQGKGVALRTAFREVEKKGFKHAVTIDADGQHDPKDLATFAEALEKQSGCIYIGARNMGQNSIPGKSKFGHKNSNFWFWVETGIPAEDTQSGYRLYPIKKVNKIHLFTWKYEFEIEIIVKAAWRGIDVKFIPVVVYYPEDRVSHFRPFKDFFRVTLLNIYLFTAAMLIFRPWMLLKSFFKKSPKQIWNDYFLIPNESPARKASAVGLGLFFGVIPIWGFQTVTVVALSLLFRLNKPLTVLANQISLPPLIPFVVYCSIGFASLATTGTWEVHLPNELSLQVIFENVKNYFWGSFLFGSFIAILGWFITFLLAYWLKKNKLKTNA